MHQVESGFALNVLFNIFKAITVQKCLLQCGIHIPTKFNNSQQVLFRCIKRKLLPYETTEYFAPDQFSVNGFFLFCFFAFFNPFSSQGEGNLISRFSPGASGFGIWFDQDLRQAPLSVPGLGGGGFN